MRSSPFVTDISGDELKQMGITSFGYIKTSEIVFSDEVRHICEGNRITEKRGRVRQQSAHLRSVAVDV